MNEYLVRSKAVHHDLIGHAYWLCFYDANGILIEEFIIDRYRTDLAHIYADVPVESYDRFCNALGKSASLKICSYESETLIHADNVSGAYAGNPVGRAYNKLSIQYV